jgi:hypothetical protein
MNTHIIMRRYIDEYYEPENRQWLSPTPNELKSFILESHNSGKSIDDIVKLLQDKLYIFIDEEETKWEKEVVENTINGKPVINRWTGIEFK